MAQAPTEERARPKGMAWIPARHVRHGLRPALPRGGSGPRGVGRRVLARRAPRHEPRVHALREGDRARDVGREGARPRAVPRRAGGHALRGLRRVSEDLGPGRPEQPLQLVDVDPRRRLAASRGAGEHAARARAAPRRARRLRRRRGLRGLGREGPADRGRVGARGARRPRGRRVRLGRRVHAEGQADGEHVAGRVPVREHAPRRLRGNLTGRQVPAERLRPLRRGRERLGVDGRLVHVEPRARLAVLRAATYAPRASTRTTPRRSRAR